MTLGNTPARHHVFQLEQNKSFAFLMKFHLKEVVDDVYLPYSLEGAAVRMVVRAPEHLGSEVVLELTAAEVDADAGAVRFSMQAADLDMEPGEYRYDITLLTSIGYSVPVMKGLLVIGSNADEYSSNVYSFTDPGTVFSIEIHNGATVEVAIKNPDFLRGPQGDPAGIYVQASTPGPDSPLEYTALWVDTDEDPTGTGPRGPAGPAGPQGDGLKIKGVAPFWMALPSTGIEMGDVFYLTGSDEFVIFTGSSWEVIEINLGPQGPVGPAGPPGATGERGLTGPAGADGMPPAGAVIAFAGVTTPAGWLLCNGAAVSRATYAALWASIGTTYGAGNGTTTFNLPNLQNRVALGSGSRGRGATGGSETVVLDAGSLPAHNHGMSHTHRTPEHAHTGSVSGGAHDHPIDLDTQNTSEHGHAGTEAASAGPGPSGTTNPATNGVVGPPGSDHTHALTITLGGGGDTGAPSTVGTGVTGSGAAHENMPPFLVLNYIIKT